jgi:hypothetical protein
VTRHFCTYFDHRYLPHALALTASLRRHCRDFRLWALCLDDAALEALRALSIAEVTPIALADFERGDDPLAAAKQNRSTIEYYFTCTPSLPLFVLRRDPSIDTVTYLDADLFFFSDPEPLFEEIGSSSVAIIPHRFPVANAPRFERYGIFNVGWLTFRRTAAGLTCLHWWRERCLEWCFDREEPSRFADQKYLDDWPSRFTDVHVIQHKGANVASWNLANYQMTERHGTVFVDDQPLVFFHFHHLKRRRTWLFETDLAPHGARLNRVLKEDVFTPYCRTLDEKAAEVATLVDARPAVQLRPTPRPGARLPLLATLSDLASGNLMLYLGGRVR